MNPADTSSPASGTEALHAASRLLGTAAAETRRAGRDATAALCSGELLTAALRHPRAGFAAARTLLRTLTRRQGLGHGFAGGRRGTAAEYAGLLLNRTGLARDMAVTGLRLRVEAAALRHPELLEGPLARLIQAIEEDRQAEAVKIFRSMAATDGTSYSLSSVAPVFADLLAWNALLDENPFNDRSAWAIATGEVPDAEPLLGIPISFWAFFDRGAGRAELLPTDVDLHPRLGTGGGITQWVRNIAALGNVGRVMVHTVTVPDGPDRYVLQMSGMGGGAPRNDSPMDLVGGFTNVGRTDTPYTRAARKAVAACVPAGAKVAIIGHSQGGAAAMNLASLPEFTGTYEVTHVVAVGSPIDYKKPADPRTRIISLVNEHDIVPALDGRSAVSPYRLPDGWLEITWLDTSHAFPLCHAAERYAENLDHQVPEARDRIDALLAPYCGPVTGTHVFRLYDH
ncbi:hypothetical protein OG897_35340 [Streptomyces sp. NBC_00237]|uniref:hypothetical protein n=1 Tax=Streptomyces sp. NBC_00237 TaxID=2975687 RepID=UPI00225AA296|nr:hypothetical protein [Streptomyces sp. NBC_00237]MCX5206668.1 hypothetical protein [Streptomyces sp. NBC_00237]